MGTVILEQHPAMMIKAAGNNRLITLAARRVQLATAIISRSDATTAVRSAGGGKRISERYQMISAKKQFAELRERLCQEHIAGGLIYLESGPLMMRNGYDVHHKFR